jgi:hypothetical protein
MKMKNKLFNILLITITLHLGLKQSLIAQDQTANWTPEEQRELFGYCEKNTLINDLKIAEDKADKIGQINYWATLQKIKVQENTNDTFATANEVEAEVMKKYKSLSLSNDQLKFLADRRKMSGNTEPCAVVTLNYNLAYDTTQKTQMILNFKTKYRKDLISKLGVNGRQADQLIDAEVWKQKEAISISKIPINNFNRIKKTVEMNHMMERKYKLVDMSDQQKAAAIEFFKQN